MDIQLIHDILYIHNKRNRQEQWHLSEIPIAGKDKYGTVKSGITVEIKDGIPEVSSKVVQLQDDGTISELIKKSLPENILLIRGYDSKKEFPKEGNSSCLYFDISTSILYQYKEDELNEDKYIRINSEKEEILSEIENNYLTKDEATGKFLAKEGFPELLQSLSVDHAKESDLSKRAIADRSGRIFDQEYVRKSEHNDIDNKYIVLNNDEQVTVNQSKVPVLTDGQKVQYKYLPISNQEVTGIVKTGEGLAISEYGDLSIDMKQLENLFRRQLVNCSRSRNFSFDHIVIKQDLNSYIAKIDLEKHLEPYKDTVYEVQRGLKRLEDMEKRVQELESAVSILKRMVLGYEHQ